ncbi:dephospho-CoA kinase [Colwellia polaris]|jgi:dephospho-CoA kinase|uniref:dephospho-CoA kinase n=1 Tax=Colwellia polaris TaxID=326537 RepID=UPI000A175BB7|nr:dephospho-CoA kinase [Colwellia polaris]|tara:strand:- start:2225 stop:2839 length:615 start_codon:yes stop_codon:yes gene_type:complete
MSKFIVGLTGGIGSGKTTVSDMFAKLNIDIIDADIAARTVVMPGSKALIAIEANFGPDFITPTGELDRTKLRSRIFSNSDDKTWLNNLLHPLIRTEILSQISQAKSNYCVLVAPLLIENNLQKLVNRVLVINIDEANQIARTAERDPSSVAEIKRIIASQMPSKQRLSFADDVINNQDISLDDIQQQVIALDQKYRTLALKHSG